MSFFPLVADAARMVQSGASPVPRVAAALLLVQSEGFAAIDRRALREAGVGHVRVMTSGVHAARVLAGKVKNDQEATPDVVFVHSQLADMTGADFVELVHFHPLPAALPIVLVCSSAEAPDKANGALAQGFSGVLARPYSGESMRLALEHAAAVKKARAASGPGLARLDTDLFDRALERFEAMQDASARHPAPDERKRLAPERRRSARTATHLYAQGVPVTEEDQEEETTAPYFAASGRKLAIEPLPVKSLAPVLFRNNPDLNEALAVAKATWKIFRSAKL
jgi:CheY-like chemotaxis protein